MSAAVPEPMSYAVPGPKPRPAVVTAAVAVLFFLIPVRLVSSVAGFVLINALAPAVAANAGTTDLQTVRLATEIGVAVGAVFGLVLIAGYAVLAAFVAKGRQVARVLTWVFGGIGILVEFVGLRPEYFTTTAPHDAAGNPIPGWIYPTAGTTTSLTLVGLILAVGLLAMPSAHDYFRRLPSTWVPGVYPPYGQVPTVPVYQQYQPQPPPGTTPAGLTLRPPAPTADFQPLN